ncbi:MAG: preprotein translocase subunit SecG [Patescibacteria group bacterium]
MNSIFDYITVVTALIVTILILIQTRGASLGAGLGGGGDSEVVRRGSDRSLHQITIGFVIVFSLSLVAGFLV